MKKFRLLFVSAAASLLFLSSCEKDNNNEIRSANFEKLTVGTSGYWNGADGSGVFQCEDMKFTNSYTDAGANSYWSGFAYSQKNDVTTADYGNQYSVYDSSNGNNKFAIFFPPYGEDVYASFPTGAEYLVKSISLCNSTYVALSMKNGDSYAKRFGGTSGNDADWFKVTIKGFDVAGTSVGTVDFYLADYQSSDNTKDYIINKWTEVDLTSLGKINKLTFSFSSSDNSAWGMNTPSYTCIDNIKYEIIAE
jgi:hypothetical protein